jgi:hypothetical protein
VRGGEVRAVGDLELTPPAGPERLVALWCRRQPELSLAQLASLVGGPALVSRPYLATRDVMRVQQAVQRLAPDEWHARVVELDHQAA